MPHEKPIILGIGEILWDLLPAGKQLGGAPANFAYHAASLGAKAAVVSRVGDDVLGREILERLDRLGLDRAHVQIDSVHPTGVVDVTIDSAGVPEYVIRAEVAWDFLSENSGALELAKNADAICFGSLGQRSAVSRAAIRALLGAAPAHCLRVCDINLRQHYFDREIVQSLLGASDILKLNDQELPVVASLVGVSGADPFELVRDLLKKYPLELIALTRGPGGSVLFPRDGEPSEHPGFASPVADTVGAGDAFTAALVSGLLAGHSLDRINIFANRLAAFVCSQPGATPKLPDSILRTQ